MRFLSFKNRGDALPAVSTTTMGKAEAGHVNVSGRAAPAVSVIHPGICRASAYDLEEIEHSGLFDVEFYLSQVPQAKDYPRGPAAHYLELGSADGHDPHCLFDSEYYAACNPEVAERRINPLLHFILSGVANGANPHPLFDILFYLNSNPEVAKSGINPLLHYWRIGALERLNPHPLFDTTYYLEQKPAGFGWRDNPLLHFLWYWHRDRISPHPLFDMSFYMSANPELADAGTNPLIHFVLFATESDRDPHPLFDTSYYLEQKPQNLNPWDIPVAHFLKYGGQGAPDPHPLFDVSFYLDMNPNVAEEGMNALRHFVRFGAIEQLDPSPYFDTAYYLETYASARESKADPLTHYLTEGAKLGHNPSLLFDTRFYIESCFKPGSEADLASDNPLVDYAKCGRHENRITRRPEPKFALVDDAAQSLKLSPGLVLQTSFAKTFEAIGGPCKHLFLLGCLMRGGAERSACHAIRLAVEKASSLKDILVIVTDVSMITCLEWLPKGTRVVNLAELQKKLSVYDRGALTMRLMIATQAETVHIFNSPRAYAAVAYYFDYYPRPQARILAYLCGYELYTEHNFSGFLNGPLHRAAPHLDMIITDNNRLREAINERYKHVCSIESKAVTCYQPLMTTLHQDVPLGPSAQVLQPKTQHKDPIEGNNRTDRNDRNHRNDRNDRTERTERNDRSDRQNQDNRQNPDEPQKVIWASRLDATKRPDLLARIAHSMPAVQFEVYGYSSSGYDFNFLRKLRNIKLMGEYSDFSEIPKSEKAVFLYTSEADGMPNVLLEAVGNGFPVVAPDVGGIRELITDNSGWLVRRFDDVDQYVKLLKYVLAHPQEAKDRGRRASNLLKQRHSWSAFSSRLSSLGVV
jgi:glycosyltransferase involved in cell wall biosynthesis